MSQYYSLDSYTSKKWIPKSVFEMTKSYVPYDVTVAPYPAKLYPEGQEEESRLTLCHRNAQTNNIVKQLFAALDDYVVNFITDLATDQVGKLL